MSKHKKRKKKRPSLVLSQKMDPILSLGSFAIIELPSKLNNGVPKNKKKAMHHH